MRIVVSLSSSLLSEALGYYLQNDGHVVGMEADRAFDPDAVIIDLNAAADDLPARYPGAKILLLDTGLEPEALVKAIVAGKVDAVLPRDSRITLFSKALEAVMEGRAWLTNTLKELLDQRDLLSKTGRAHRLTDQERTIVRHVCQGLGNKEIAYKLNLSCHTVKSHMRNIFRKAGVTGRCELVAFALSNNVARLSGQAA
jgi:two-component system NarL family response regulator